MNFTIFVFHRAQLRPQAYGQQLRKRRSVVKRDEEDTAMALLSEVQEELARETQRREESPGFDSGEWVVCF